MSSATEQEMSNVTESWDPVEISPSPKCFYLLNPGYKFSDDTEQKNELKESMSCYFEGKCPNKYKFKDCKHIDVDGEKQYGFCKLNPNFKP